MGLFFNGEYEKDQAEKMNKSLESFKAENKMLKEKLSNAVTMEGDNDENAKNLKAMLTVVEILRKLDKEELVLDVSDSLKNRGDISVGVMDKKTKKQLFAIVAEGKDKKEKGRYYTFYDYTAHKAAFVFPNSAIIPVPKFFLADVSGHITSHIDNWSKALDKENNEQLDKVLEKIGA